MKRIDRKSLLAFVIVAYAISWLCWIVAFFIFRLGIYGPLIASILVTYYYFKTQGLREFVGRSTLE